MAEEGLRRTPLYALHKEIGGRLVPFAGWEMPVQYSGILEESRAVRTAVGLFDISHMGRTHVRGSGALPLLQQVTSNDVSALASGQAQYSLLTNPRGGIIDDIIVYRLGVEEFTVVLNASNTQKDLDWMRSQSGGSVTIDEYTERTGMIAVQGPKAPDLVARLSGQDLSRVDRFSFVNGEIAGASAALCRTGYTGEDGFELIVPAEKASDVWRALQEGGGVPCGLGARDALRIEAGYPLYGHEIDDTTTPVEAGLMWVVKLDKGEFTGRDVIAERKRSGAGRKLVGIKLAERIVPRQGYTLYVGDTEVGTVTSGVFSPVTGRGIGLAYVDDPHNKIGTTLQVQIRANRYDAAVVPKKSLLES
jgi:aminomethyltransferase